MPSKKPSNPKPKKSRIHPGEAEFIALLADVPGEKLPALLVEIKRIAGVK